MWRREYCYGIQHVEYAMRMVSDNLSLPHQFVVAVDDEYYGDIIRSDLDVGVVRISKELYRPGKRFQKLMVFRPDAATLFGERMLVMDLDNVVVGSLDGIASREEDIVLWRNPSPTVKRTPYNTSITLLAAGCRPHVWTEFNIDSSPSVVKAERYSGTDQAWVSRCLGKEAVFTEEDGVYSYRLDYLKSNVGRQNGERVVCFHGNISPESDIVKTNHRHFYETYRGGKYELSA